MEAAFKSVLMLSLLMVCYLASKVLMGQNATLKLFMSIVGVSRLGRKW